MSEAAALCAKCAAQGSCCCALDPKDAPLCFPLSLAEWRRLAPYAVLAVQAPMTNAREFAQALAAAPSPVSFIPGPPPGPNQGPPEEGDAACLPEENSGLFIASMRRLFADKKEDVAAVFPDGGRHFRVRTRTDGSCVFLGGSGCRLPREARPWYCVLFPAWMHMGELSFFNPPECLIARNAHNPFHGLRLMATGPEEVRRLYDALCADWGLHPSK